MSEDPKINEFGENEPFIPPHYMLFLSLAGVIVAIFIALTQRDFNVIGWGGLGLAVLAFVAWVLMAPDQAMAVFSGRTAQYGGTAVLVTFVVIAAMVVGYVVVRNMSLRLDLTGRDQFSLNEQSREMIRTLGADPSTPNIVIIAFYTSNQSGLRDSNSVLFDDYVETSGGRISYEFVDPDRNPLFAEQYEIERAGQIVVVPITAEGERDLDRKVTLNSANQTALTNAMIEVAAQGDFRAYFVTVEGTDTIEDTGDTGLSSYSETLTTFNWTTEQVTLLELDNPEGPIQLNDPEADGEVLIIVGGLSPLPDAQVAQITSFMDNGGDVIIFAGFSQQDEPLVIASNFSDYLWENFGVRVNNDLVLDPLAASQSPLNLIVTDFTRSHPIVATVAATGGQLLAFSPFSHSIEVAETLPAGVVVTPIMMTADTAYAKTDVTTLTQDSLRQEDDDPTGPFNLAVAAENTNTGARLVIFGSGTLPINGYSDLSGAGVQNTLMAWSSAVWATGFDEFFIGVTGDFLDQELSPYDVPVFATTEVQSNITLFTVVIVPLIILAVGIFVWWNGRERDVSAT